MNRLEQLRRDIETIDRELMDLVARRLDLAVRIGREKVRDGIPIRDWSMSGQFSADVSSVSRTSCVRRLATFFSRRRLEPISLTGGMSATLTQARP